MRAFSTGVRPYLDWSPITCREEIEGSGVTISRNLVLPVIPRRAG